MQKGKQNEAPGNPRRKHKAATRSGNWLTQGGVENMEDEYQDCHEKNTRVQSIALMPVQTNMQKYLALEGSHGQSFKVSSLVIGYFPVQVNLMRVTEERECRKAQNKNKTPDAQETQGYDSASPLMDIPWCPI